jgi:hypothetical protein
MDTNLFLIVAILLIFPLPPFVFIRVHSWLNFIESHYCHCFTAPFTCDSAFCPTFI